MVKTMTAFLHKAINVMTDELEMQKNLITLMDTLIAHGIEDNDALEARLASTSERPDLIVDKALLNAFDSWCKGEGIDDAESFTSKVDEMATELDEYRSSVQNELENIASAIDTIEGL